MSTETRTQRYADRQPDLAALCLVRMSELYPGRSMLTVGRADFRVYRSNKREAMRQGRVF